MMQQFHDAKAACPGALLLFRMGDFYELFQDDAQEAARLLGLTLTSREKGENAMPMAGFPHHQLDNYLAKLIAAGRRVAICDQVEDPKLAKGLVKREVTRVVSPGTLTDEALLDPGESNFLAALVAGPRVGLSWVELSTGRFLATTIAPDRVPDELARIAPRECLLSDEAPAPGPSTTAAVACWTRRPAWAFAAQAAREACQRQFGTSTLEGFGFDDDDQPGIRAAGALLEYLQESQRCNLAHLDRLTPYRDHRALALDAATRRSLELTRTIRDGRREGTLLAVLDRTVTAMGSRLLADWLANPLVDVAAIEERHTAVAELVADGGLAESLRDQLRQIYDLERLLARVTTGRASPRDLSSVSRTLARLPLIKARLTARQAPLLNRLEGELDLCVEVRGALSAALVDDCPLSPREGGFIRPGYDVELDRLRLLAAGGKQWIAQYQAQEIERSGIPTLKVGFNKVFGYYIEITNPHKHKVPAGYTRRQTVKNAERYVTEELKQYEEQVLSADERSQQLEYDRFLALRAITAEALGPLLATARVLAALDALVGLAHLARERGYCRPSMNDDGRLRIVDGRHPVLDICQPAGEFVPNDTLCECDTGRVLLITGPNMAGKSTYLRQTALLVLMAQMGSFVPARTAEIGVADRIFARVGASDELARGQSTFMVEMTETARILHTATERSLVILDEIGRGTSTYDGVSLAWAVVEHLHDRVGCRTLFATHYHELTDLEKTLPRVQNLNVVVREWQDEVVFLHKIAPGAADKSYGIQVARLAGVPGEVLERAKGILWQLESQHLGADGRPHLAPSRPRQSRLQLTLFEPADHPLLDQVRGVNVDELTPLAALALVKAWQDSLGETALGKPR